MCFSFGFYIYRLVGIAFVGLIGFSNFLYFLMFSVFRSPNLRESPFHSYDMLLFSLVYFDWGSDLVQSNIYSIVLLVSFSFLIQIFLYTLFSVYVPL